MSYIVVNDWDCNSSDFSYTKDINIIFIDKPTPKIGVSFVDDLGGQITYMKPIKQLIINDILVLDNIYNYVIARKALGEEEKKTFKDKLNTEYINQLDRLKLVDHIY